MRRGIIAKSLLIWITFIPFAVLNGAMREYLLIPLMGAGAAYPLSGLILACFVFALSFLLVPRLGRANRATYVAVGVCWLVLTVLFELGLGLAEGQSLGELVQMYNIATGDLWLLVVLFMGVAPLLVAKLRKLH